VAYHVSRPKAIKASGVIVARLSASPPFEGSHGLLVPIDRPAEDVSGDCVVDLVDLDLLLNDWDETRPLKTDLNDDGRVDVLDLLRMIRSMS